VLTVKDSDPNPGKPNWKLKGQMKKILCFKKLDGLFGGLEPSLQGWKVL
jgi:hypothetical protein